MQRREWKEAEDTFKELRQEQSNKNDPYAMMSLGAIPINSLTGTRKRVKPPQPVALPWSLPSRSTGEPCLSHERSGNTICNMQGSRLKEYLEVVAERDSVKIGDLMGQLLCQSAGGSCAGCQAAGHFAEALPDGVGQGRAQRVRGARHRRCARRVGYPCGPGQAGVPDPLEKNLREGTDFKLCRQQITAICAQGRVHKSRAAGLWVPRCRD